MLNKVRKVSNMYSFLNDYPKKDSNRGFTWNPIKGCKFSCSYCYVQALSKRYGYSMKPRFMEKELKTNLGENNFIFVGSTSDTFGNWINSKDILKILHYCNEYPKNKYLFQTKNPKRFREFIGKFPPNVILATTLETNYAHLIDSKAPPPIERYLQMVLLSKEFRVMISLEPLIDFDLETMVDWIKKINPEFVSIGANSKLNLCKLPEPSKEKVEALIKELEKFTEVKRKSNLSRLLN